MSLALFALDPREGKVWFDVDCSFTGPAPPKPHPKHYILNLPGPNQRILVLYAGYTQLPTEFGETLIANSNNGHLTIKSVVDEFAANCARFANLYPSCDHSGSVRLIYSDDDAWFFHSIDWTIGIPETYTPSCGKGTPIVGGTLYGIGVLEALIEAQSVWSSRTADSFGERLRSAMVAASKTSTYVEVPAAGGRLAARLDLCCKPFADKDEDLYA